MIIDFHYHYADTDDLVNDLIVSMDRAGIDKTVLLSGDKSHYSEQIKRGVRGNEETLKVIKKYPDRIIGGIYLDPRQPNSMDTLEKYVEAGFKCIKMFPPAGYFPDEEAFYPLYEKIQEYGLPILFHTGLTNTGYRGKGGPVMHSKYSHPLNFDILVRLFPRISFVFAHMGYPHYMEAWAIAAANPNVYLDISGSGCQWMRGAPYVYNALGVANYTPLDFKRVLWGSDNILSQEDNIAEAREHMKNMGCTPEDEKYIFGENAKKLLKL